MATRNISIETKAGLLEGFCDSRFEGVLDAFVTNFESRGEVGANVALTLDGKPVVDLWGGRKSKEGAPWTSDTMCTIFSSTKGALALLADAEKNASKVPDPEQQKDAMKTVRVLMGKLKQ